MGRGPTWVLTAILSVSRYPISARYNGIDMENERLGVLGGTFDPIHYGHLQIAEQALNQFHLSRVLFIPAGDPPHKLNDPVTDARDRYAMTVLATASHPRFEVSTIELDRSGRSYTVDTLSQLHETYGQGTEIYFILGADAVLELHTWKNPARVITLCEILVSNRPGFDLADVRAVPVAGLAERVELLDGIQNQVSSTVIRSRASRGESIRYLTPDGVADYISKRGLYQQGRECTAQS